MASGAYNCMRTRADSIERYAAWVGRVSEA
jgi:hypothetical protein